MARRGGERVAMLSWIWKQRQTSRKTMSCLFRYVAQNEQTLIHLSCSQKLKCEKTGDSILADTVCVLTWGSSCICFSLNLPSRCSLWNFHLTWVPPPLNNYRRYDFLNTSFMFVWRKESLSQLPQPPPNLGTTIECCVSWHVHQWALCLFYLPCYTYPPLPQIWFV